MNRFDPGQNKPSDSIRSEIDETRQRMNSTIDALTERLKGRHLVDELLGLLRSGNSAGAAASTVNTVKHKVAETTGATVHAVVEAVKSHPLPVLVMGAGLAWLIYEKERKTRESSESYSRYDPESMEPSRTEGAGTEFEEYFADYSAPTATPAGEGEPFDPPEIDPHGPDPSEPGMKERIQDSAGRARHTVQQTATRLADKAGQLGDRAREGMQHVKQRTARATSQAREMAVQTKDQVAAAAQEHPLETGLTCLAVGLLAGMLTPTPQRVRDEVEPLARRVRHRAREASRDVLERGKRVVTAATEAARHEAQNQGLTPEAMRRHAGPTNESRGDAAGSTVSGAPGRPPGDWPGQDESASPPTPAVQAGISGDERRATGQPAASSQGLPPPPAV